MAAAVLREANYSLPRSFRALVNDKGSFTLVVADTSVPASSYAPYFDALTTKLNQSFPVGNNPWLPFRPTPTFVQLAIRSLPISLMPYDDSLLYDELHDSIINSRGVSISAARFLNPDLSSRAEKRAFLVVVNVNPADVPTLLPSLHPFGGTRKVARAYSSYPSTQYCNCWEFGHVQQRCRTPHPVYLLCSLYHAKNEHRCPNPSSPGDGNLHSVLNCYLASPAKCPNCEDNHSASFRECPARPALPPPRAVPPTNDSPPGSPILPPADVDMDDVSGGRPQTALQNQPALGPPFQFETPRAPLRQSVPLRSRSSSRHGFVPLEVESSPSPFPLVRPGPAR